MSCAEHCYHAYSGPVMMIVRQSHVLEKCCQCSIIRQVHRDHASSGSHRQLAKWSVALALIASCALPHVPAQPRGAEAKWATLALVQSSCTEESRFNSADPTDMPQIHDPDSVWVPDQYGTGVVISERRILIAAHEVRCPMIPYVHATVMVGGAPKTFRMSVIKDDMQFGRGRDVAVLEISSADEFGIHIPPPLLFSVSEPGTAPHGEVCAHHAFGTFVSCGIVDERNPSLIHGMRTRPGDSGAPIYDNWGHLVGLSVAGGGVDTTMVLLEPEWLEGT